MKKLVCTISALFIAACMTQATPITITDTTAGTAVLDGTINALEYVGSSAGINSGFGNVIGSSSLIHMDSDLAGNLNIGIQGGGGTFDNVGVIYIDSIGGGFNDLVGLNDTGDDFRAAISGDGTGGDFSDMTFAPGFNADFAIAVNSTSGGVFGLVSGGSHNYLGATGFSSVAANNWEMSTTLGTLGINPGDSFNYVVTYLTPSNAYRSDEFHGVAQSTANSGNIGTNGNPGPGGGSISLAANDFNTFVSVPEPNTMVLLGLGLLGLVRARLRG